MICNYESFIEFYTDLVLGSKLKSEEKSPQRVKIYTIHKSKGLEFSYVFLPCWVERCLPRLDEDIEEERKLAYVALTRARKYVRVSYPTHRKKIS